MCGIAGIVGRVTELNRQALRRISTAMTHRGPDGENFFESAPDGGDDGILLAHRRLSILDLSNAASQPMTDAKSGHHTFVFNGEIYNYRELRQRLRGEGHAFTSSGDTEVALRLLASNGLTALADLRGMFALALWDGRERRLTLARDPMGMKPLYIYRNPDTSPTRQWSMLFASEVRAILASGLLNAPRLDPDAVTSFVWNGFVPGPSTIIEGIGLLPAGRALVIDLTEGGRASEKIWRLPASGSSETSTVADVRDALHESVRLHLASDVPLGIFLSGGIDSSAVANMAAKASGSELLTFTLAFDEGDYDESRSARQVAAAIGTQHREVRFTERHLLASLDQAIESIDQPTFDGINSFYISQAVREAGLKVVLAGSGGDELFGGYKTFRDLPRFQAIVRHLAWLPAGGRVAMARAVAQLATRRRSRIGGQTRWSKLPSMVSCSEDLLYLYQLAYGLFVPDFHGRLLNLSAGSIACGLPNSLRGDLRESIEGLSALSALGVLEQRLFLGERLLRDTDVASMAVSLETRLPLVDRTVTDVVSRLPDAIRYAPLGRKQLLRDIGLEGLDPTMFERPKRGFQMPFGHWIHQRLGREMDRVMRDRDLCRSCGLNGDVVAQLWQSFRDRAGGLYWSRVWAIYVLLRWCDRHAVSVR